jgi:hypothetical protein
MSNVFLNYNIHGRSIFDGSKVKLSVNNIFDDHSIVAIGAANDGTTLAIALHHLRVHHRLPGPPALHSELGRRSGKAGRPRVHDQLPDRSDQARVVAPSHGG